MTSKRFNTTNIDHETTENEMLNTHEVGSNVFIFFHIQHFK